MNQRNPVQQFDPISLEIMWSRLIGIADEMWTTVLRTAVSTIIGAAQDFGCEILDANGSSLSHSNRSMPVFNLVMPNVARKVMERYPAETMQPGDVYVTNDPWICAGHLDDIATVTPVFRDGAIVAFTVVVAHTSSIGGSLSAPTVRDLYEEGLQIPILKLYDRGEPNGDVFSFIRENVRMPEMVLTDIEAQVTANELGNRRLLAFLDEYQLSDLSKLADTVQRYSERAMRRAIDELPDGVYENEVQIDGMGDPLTLRCRVEIDGSDLTIDYAGTDSQQPRGGINSTLIYTQAHTVYPLKCLLSPDVPANEGTFRPITATAPEGSILNCRKPASVGSRTRTGWHIHSLLFGALEPIMPDRVQAGNGLMNSLRIYGQEPNGGFYNAHFFLAGGRGASKGRDGIGRNCFPSSARNVPVEVLELRTPVLVRNRSLRPDSAGQGEWRGAFGHEFEISRLPGYPEPVSCFFDPDRLHFPPRGLAGGKDGPRATLYRNGQQLTPEQIDVGGTTLASDEDRFAWHVPGGAGYGPPERRDPDKQRDDEASGLVARER